MNYPDPSITESLQKAKAALEFVESTSAKGCSIHHTISELDSYARGLRDLQTSLSNLPPVIKALRKDIHDNRMIVQASLAEK